METAPLVVLLAAALQACNRKEEKKKPEARAPVEPIPYQSLVPLLPKLEGWEAKPPRGELTTVGTEKLSFARAEYAKSVEGQQLSLSLEILDGTYGSSAYAPFAALAHTGGHMADPHRMPIKMEGASGIQQWNPQERTVRVLLLVARRFVVTLKGSNLTPPLVNQTLQAIDLKKLASLAAGDAQHR